LLDNGLAMPRTPDPTRLTTEEGAAFRTFVKQMRERMGVRNANLAEILNCAETTVAAVLRDSRGPGKPNTLLPRSALTILRAFELLSTKRDERRALARYRDSVTTEHGWLGRVYVRNRQPAVFVVPGDVERLAALLADEICADVAKSRRDVVQRAAARMLRREAAGMLAAWDAQVTGSVERFIAQAKPRAKSMVTVPAHPRKKRWVGWYGNPFEQRDPSLFAVEVLHLAVELHAPRGKKPMKDFVDRYIRKQLRARKE